LNLFAVSHSIFAPFYVYIVSETLEDCPFLYGTWHWRDSFYRNWMSHLETSDDNDSL